MDNLVNLLDLSSKTFSCCSKNRLNPFLLEKFIKKALIYLIKLFDIVKLLINTKTHSTIYNNFNISNITQKAYIQALLSPSNPEKLKIDKALLNLDINQLINQIKLEDVQLYLWINKIHIEKHKHKEIKFKDFIGKIHTFKLFYEEKKKFICCKSKRKDEILKFSFKLLRKKMLFRFEKKIELKCKNQMNLKQKFKQTVLNNDDNLYKTFFSYDVSRKDLIFLQSNPSIKKILIEELNTFFLKDIIDNIISFDQSIYYDSNIEIYSFFLNLFSNQQKKSLVLQDGVNALEVFRSYFY